MMSGGGVELNGALGMLLSAQAKGVLLLVAVAGASLALRRAPAAARHWVWFLGMTGLLVLPLLERMVPRWSVRVPAWEVVAEEQVEPAPPAAAGGAVEPTVGVTSQRHPARPATAVTTAAPDLGRAPEGASSPTAAATTGATEPEMGGAPERTASPIATATGPAELEDQRVLDRGPVTTLAGAPGSARPDRGPAAQEPAAPRAASLPLVLLGLWGAGAASLLLALAASVWSVARLGRRCTPFPPGRVSELTGRLRAELGVRGPVRLLRGEPGAMPMSWGAFRATILLPEGAERWHTGRLASVLLHELAHVRRRDCLTQMVAEAVLALHWINPLAWLAVRRLRVEREHACDDAVVAAGTCPSEYAEELLSLARGFHPVRGSALAAVAMARPVHLTSRLRAVLEERPVRTLSRRGAAAATTLAAGLVLLLAAFTPGGEPSASDDQEARQPATPADVREPAEPGEAPPRPVAPAETTDPAEREPTTTPPSATTDGAEVQTTTPAPYRSEWPRITVATLLSLQQTTCGIATDGWRRISHTHNSDGDRHTLTWERRGCEVEIRVDGEIEFTGDFQDVARLGRNALLRIEEDEGGTERRLDVTAGASGAPAYQYRIDGREQPFDAAARAWYRGMLLQAFRRGGFMAEERVASLLRSGGVGAVLQELEALSSDYVFGTYTRELLEQAELTDAQAVDVVGRATRQVDSDHYMAEILDALAANHLESDRVLEAFIAASRTVESDHYRTQVLTRALQRGALPSASVAAVLESAAEISSDHYLSELLRAVAGRYALEPSLRATYLAAVESIESDHYRSEVLSTLLERNDLEPGELAVALRATRGVGSDHYRNEILARVARRDLSSDELRGAYLQAAGQIGSDHYRQEALAHLLERGSLSDAHLREVIRAAGGIESDHYKSQLLLRIARDYALEGETREDFLDALDTVESRHYRGQVAEALLRREARG